MISYLNMNSYIIDKNNKLENKNMKPHTYRVRKK